MKINMKNYYENTLDVYKPLLFDFNNHFLLWGSRKSGKSWFVVEYIFFCCLYFPNLRVLLLRCFAAKVRETTFANYKEAAIRLKLMPLIAVMNETKILFKNGSCIKYSGMMGNEASLKDSEYDCIVYEEGEQSLRSHYTALVNNLRPGQGGIKKSSDGSFKFNKKLIIAMNPPTEITHYTVKMFNSQDDFPAIRFLKTTIDDNKHATQADFDELEAIKHFDEFDYRRLRFGEIQPRKDGLFFIEKKHFYFINEKQYIHCTQHTKHEKKIMERQATGTPKELKIIEQKSRRIKKLIQVYGGDFAAGVGRDPLTLLEIYIDFDKWRIFVKDIIYDNTISEQKDIIKAMNELGVNRNKYQFWDSQYPMTIGHICTVGKYKAEPAYKPSILDSIEILKNFTIYICASETFKVRDRTVKQQHEYLPLRQQIGKYSRKFDKKNECFLDEPEADAANQGIDFWDALRYGVTSYMKKFNKKSKTFKKK